MPTALTGPAPKRQKLIDTGKTPEYGAYRRPSAQQFPSQVIDKSAESSFIFEPLPRSNTLSDDYVLDITKYIPVGCLRIQKMDFQVSTDIWKSQDFWSAFTIPRDVYNKRDGPFLLNALQDIILKSTFMKPYETLLNSGLIRMEFKSKDANSGQFRVYMLPDDVGRADIDRSQRSIFKGLKLLLRQIDISSNTWNGQWFEDTPVSHIDSSLDETVLPREEESLFNIFNTLPSPAPNPDRVNDKFAKDSMRCLLDNDIWGLETNMYSYQRRSAAMMLQREAQPEQILDPRLHQLVDQKGGAWYCDPDSGFISREPRKYEAARGGICAENMGLGKTLICLALILATRGLMSHIPAEYSVGLLPVRKTTGSLVEMAAAAVGRTATPYKLWFAQQQDEGQFCDRTIDAIREQPGHYFLPSPEPIRESRHASSDPPRKILISTSTIVVVPANLIEQWCGEIRKHTDGSLKVLVMKNNKALPPAQELLDFDIILFSKLRFDKEAKDGLESNDGQNAKEKTCRCSYSRGQRMMQKCKCREDYRSPLKDVHFKRLIFDEGHTVGNSSSSSQTEAFTLVNSLQVDARWVVSGTPTRGLYGTESGVSSGSTTPLQHDDEGGYQSTLSSTPSSTEAHEIEKNFYEQERKDLDKLGNIATYFLRARPWAPSSDGDVALWNQHVMQPRHGSKSHGNPACLRATLEGMIIRHKPADVIEDVSLPPLYQDTICLEGCLQNTLALNTFNMMIITNAITSERKDADYFFHARQLKNLKTLVWNMRQGSFFWSGFDVEHVKSTIENAKKFLEKGEVQYTPEDGLLLNQVIEYGEVIVSNGIYNQIRQWHEMPMFIQNNCPEEIRQAMSLDGNPRDPTLMGATMIHDAQKFVESQLWKEDPMDGLRAAVTKSLQKAALDLNPPSKPATDPSPSKKATKKDLAPDLAGGVSIGYSSKSKKRARPQTTNFDIPPRAVRKKQGVALSNSPAKSQVEPPEDFRDTSEPWSLVPGTPVAEGTQLKSALKKSEKPDVASTLDPSSPLNSASIISTASTKLSYLLDRIVRQQAEEKILVFYETDNIAYYIAQALECLNIKHLIYAKSLKSEVRSRYVVAFNNTETFRVLLMDVSQAAFGLDISSASRVYFVNPVFSPQVEAQAVKRAHRIGQMKPVYVVTLVLKGSIEEAIVSRRKDMTNEEHNKCRSILDDETLYNWIRNVKFLPMPTADFPDSEQMAKLQTPQKIFGIGAGSRSVDDLNAENELLIEISASAKSGEVFKKTKPVPKPPAGSAMQIDDGDGTFSNFGEWSV